MPLAFMPVLQNLYCQHNKLIWYNIFALFITTKQQHGRQNGEALLSEIDKINTLQLFHRKQGERPVMNLKRIILQKKYFMACLPYIYIHNYVSSCHNRCLKTFNTCLNNSECAVAILEVPCMRRGFLRWHT